MAIATRKPLSRERVLKAALKLADQHGLEAVTMRGLARSLAVEPMSLYNHVPSKDALLDAMVATVLGQFEAPTPGPDWERSVRRLAVSGHETLLKHPWACTLVISPQTAGLGFNSRLKYIEALLKCLQESGFTAEHAYYGYHAIDSYILGFTMWQIGHNIPNDKRVAEALKLVNFAEFPYLEEHAQLHMHRPAGAKHDFEFGLDLIIDGLQKLKSGKKA